MLTSATFYSRICCADALVCVIRRIQAHIKSRRKASFSSVLSSAKHYSRIRCANALVFGCAKYAFVVKLRRKAYAFLLSFPSSAMLGFEGPK